MSSKAISRSILGFLIVMIIAPSFVLAAPNILPGQIVPKQCNEVGGCKSICDLAQVAQNVLNTGIYIAVFLSAILFAWAGLLYLTGVAGSDLSRAKEIFKNVAIGLVIILIGWLVVDVFIRTLAGGNFSSWNKVCELFFQGASMLA